jgi:2-methylcitrate dehydratase
MANATPSTPTITATMARWAAALRYEQVSAEAVREAKRYLLDSLGCALGGYRQHDVTIALAVLDEIAGPGPATVIGSGRRIDPLPAADHRRRAGARDLVENRERDRDVVLAVAAQRAAE